MASVRRFFHQSCPLGERGELISLALVLLFFLFFLVPRRPCLQVEAHFLLALTVLDARDKSTHKMKLEPRPYSKIVHSF